MLWIKAFHIISVITYFAAVFYLPRLYVYHAMSNAEHPDDEVSNERFKVMERKLYRGIMNPSLVVMVILGGYLAYANWAVYAAFYWLHVKLLIVAGLMVYHYLCYQHLVAFRENANMKGHVYFRWFNEVPVLALIAIIILVVVQPF